MGSTPQNNKKSIPKALTINLTSSDFCLYLAHMVAMERSPQYGQELRI